MIIIIVNSLRSQSNISSPLMLANWAVTFAPFYVSPLYSSSNILKRLQYRVLPYLFISLTTRKHLPLKHCPDFSLLKHAHFLPNLATGIHWRLIRVILCHACWFNGGRCLLVLLLPHALLSTVTTIVSVFVIKRRFYSRCLFAFHSTSNLDRGSLFFWPLPFNLLGMGGPIRIIKLQPTYIHTCKRKKKNLHGKVVIPSE